MNITERSRTAEERSEIETHVGGLVHHLGLESSSLAAPQLVERVDSLVCDWQDGIGVGEGLIDPEELHIVLGSVWGNQFVETYGWSWAVLTFHDHDGWEAHAVVSADRSLMILPYAFILDCAQDPDADVTVLAAFNAVSGGVIPKMPPKSYTDVTSGVQRIVPQK